MVINMVNGVKFLEIFNDFMEEYLENVKTELPDSYRAMQLKAGGIQALAVHDFERRFLLKPFQKASLRIIAELNIDD